MMAELLPAIAGALVGGIIGSASPILHAHFQSKRAKKDVLNALAGEVIAICTDSSQEYLAVRARELLQEMKDDEELSVPKLLDDRLDPAPIYDALGDKLGHLSAEQVAFFANFHRNIKRARFRYLVFQGRTIRHDEFEAFGHALEIMLSELEKLPDYEVKAHALSKN